MRPSLSEELSYWEIEEFNNVGLGILSDGSLAMGLEILPIDIECMNCDKINQLTLSLRSFINTVPENFTLQIHVKSDSDFTKVLEKHEQSCATVNEFLKMVDSHRTTEIREDILSKRLNASKFFIYIKSPAVVVEKRFSLKTVKKFSKEFAKDFEDRREELFESLSSIQSSLLNFGFGARALSKNDLVQNIYEFINPARLEFVAKPNIFSPTEIQIEEKFLQNNPALAVDSPRAQLVFGDLVLDKAEFILDQKRTRVLTLKTLPEITVAGQMDSLRFPFHFDMLFTLKVADQTKEMKGLEQKRRMAHSLSQTRGGGVADLESESRLSTTEELIRELIQTGQRIFIAELSIILREEDSKEGLKKLNQKTRDVLGKFKTLSGAEGVWETVGAWQIFKSNMPLAPMKLERGKRLKTNNLVDFLPLYGPRIGDDTPVVLLQNRLGSLVSINPYDSALTNYNSLVTGASGSGKSFFNNFLLLQEMARNTKVFIIDIGGSYKKLTELLHGQYFEISLNDSYAINPFYMVNPALHPTSDKIKALVSIIEQMITEDGQKISKYERVLIEKAINESYEMAANEKRSPILSDFEKICQKSVEPELLKIAKLLYSWVKNSPYGKLIDRPQGLASDNAITTFDLKGLSQYPDLQAVMILILTNFILDQVEGDKTFQKRVILDEAWQLLKSDAASSFMEYAARTFRKTGSGITFITQGVEEILDSPIGSAIINNTSTKVVMQQRGDTKPLETALKLNSQELALIQSLEQRKGSYSEAFLIRGDTRQVVRVFPSPLEYWISTSDAKDNQYLEKLRCSGLTLEGAIEKSANEYPFGISQSKAHT